ncbi:MAG: hypothetical protein ACLQIB_00805 [Isosphaeraceae bacterium]
MTTRLVTPVGVQQEGTRREAERTYPRFRVPDSGGPLRSAGLGLLHDLAFTHPALLVEDRHQGLVGRAAYHVGTIGAAFDDPEQILGRLLPRALWEIQGTLGPPTFPWCQKVGGHFRAN